MNATLLCFGFDTFKLEISNDEESYKVIRDNGEPAKRLSEGEKTFIAYLYFYHKIFYTEKREKLIVIIDDPISSLDQTNMFIVRQMTREICNAAAENKNSFGICQAIVLTHNAFFFDEIAARRKGDYSDKFCYFRIRKNAETSQIIILGNEKPIQNTYKSMWHDLYDEEVPHRLKPNLMRRILEHHFVYLGQEKNLGAIPVGLDAYHHANAAALISGLHSMSHNIPDDADFHQDEEACNRLRMAFEALLEASGQGSHLKHMKASTS